MWRVCIGIQFSSGAKLLQSTVARLRSVTLREAALVVLSDPAEATSLRLVCDSCNIPVLLADGAKESGAAFQLLVQASDADLLVFLVNGTFLAPKWLETMLSVLEADLQNQIVLGHIPPADKQTDFSSGCQVLLVRRQAATALIAGQANPAAPANWMEEYCRRAKKARFLVERVTLSGQFVHDQSVPEPANPLRRVISVGRCTTPRQVPSIRPARFSVTATSEVRVATERAPRVTEEPAVISARTSVYENLPLVSCVMPTRDRPAYVRQSIRYFERQTYPERELIILDDGLQPLAGEIPIHPRIRCVRAAPGQSVGAKRNQGCELARGTIIAHWDDDDWYGADRLRIQVEPLLQNKAEITAFRETTFFLMDRWEFWRCSPEEHQRLFVGDVHGGTLVYHRNVWERLARYPCVSLAEDAAFLRGAMKGGARLIGISSQDMFLYLRHAANTWTLSPNLFRNASRWHRLVEPDLPPEDRTFYETRCGRGGRMWV